MERKKKDHGIASANDSPEADSNGLLTKQEQNQPNVASATKGMGASSPSHDNTPSLNQQYPSILQSPYTHQNNVEQPSSSSKPCVSSQSPPSIAVSQWHQSPHPPLNPASHQGHPLPHLAQLMTPSWLTHHPGHLPVVNVPAICQPFTSLGTINASWQAPGLTGGTTSSKNHSQVPSFSYQNGYPYPGFPGPWDPSTWWGQVQLSQPPATYTFPGAYGYFTLQAPAVPDCSAPLEQSSQEGIIRPPAKLSQKHQQVREAQSTENVHLWTVIGLLQSEIADYKSRMTKLESEVSTLKQAIEQPTACVTGTAVSVQPSKRGRPRRLVASDDALPSTDESQPSARGRKPKANIFEKVILSKAENKVKPSNLTAIAQQEDEKVSNVVINNNSDVGINRSKVMTSFHNQVHQEISGVQKCKVGPSSSLETQNNDGKNGDINDAFAVLTQQAKGMDHRSALASFLGTGNNGSLGWPYVITSETSGRNVLNTSSQGFYNNGSVIREGDKVVPGWSSLNEENASEELEDGVAASAKYENDEEMEDDDSSGGEEIACSKGENLPQFRNW